MKMKAGQIVAPRHLEVVEMERPEIEDGQILVKTAKGCLCGSDLPYFQIDTDHPMLAGQHAPLAPMLSLHECIGHVAASRCAEYREGDAVLALPYVHFGLAEYFPSDPARAVPIPADGPWDRIVLAQPLGTVFHAVAKLGSLINQSAVVIGQGPMGLLFTGLLARLGVRPLIAIDPDARRLAVAPRMGATATLNLDVAEAVSEVERLTGGRMADVVVEVVGQAATLSAGIPLLRRGGTLLAFGVPYRRQYQIPFSDLFLREGHIVCSVGPNVHVDFPIAVDLIASGQLDVTPLVTHRFPLERVQEAFDTFADRRDGAIKVVLDFD
jgi:2-desacetyl-2-hydroxyethyl bacteriochlorophyllide A dehydrogenase